MRLDLYLKKYKNLSDTKSKELLKNNLIKVNNVICSKNSKKINVESDIVEIIEDYTQKNNVFDELISWKTNLNIVYEDNYLLVVNKESGILTLPTKFENKSTLLNAIKYLIDSKKYNSDLTINERFGICHRLDKETSGLIIIAKNKSIYEQIQKMLFNQEIIKKYYALLHGTLETSIIDVNAPLKRIKDTNKYEISQDSDAKNAFSTFKLIESYKGFCLSEVTIKSGRTHQIRVHAQFIKHNIINDPLYGIKKVNNYGQYLCAHHLSFKHPITNKEIIIDLELPIEFQKYIKKYGQ